MKRRFHMMGIGGIGMSALAHILLHRGHQVSGCDLEQSEISEGLAARRAEVNIGHDPSHVSAADCVVVSDAVRPDHPELERARDLGLPVQRRSELLAELMGDSQGIAVSGTHGKTTVTAMLGLILAEAGLDPTVVLGGELEEFGGNVRVGAGGWFVAEACEAYESFLHLRPEIAVVTNIEPDHLDHHKTEEHLRGSFAEFVKQVSPGGSIVLCADRPELRDLPLPPGRQVIWYGESPNSGVRGSDIRLSGRTGRCKVTVDGREAGSLSVNAPGTHNIVNALGSAAAALAAGASFSACERALRTFQGVGRRFEVVGEVGGVTIVDDYAHHPTEISATVAAARAAFPGQRVLAVFQPHLYSRTRDFAVQFAQALSRADLSVLTEIYPAREQAIPGITSSLIAEHLRELSGEDAVLEMAKGRLTTELPAHVRPGDVVLSMGAGDIGREARALAYRLGGSPSPDQEVVAKQ